MLKQKNKGAIEVALTRQIVVFEEDPYETLDLLLEASGRPVTFIAMFDRDDISEAARNTLKLAAPHKSMGSSLDSQLSESSNVSVAPRASHI